MTRRLPFAFSLLTGAAACSLAYPLGRYESGPADAGPSVAGGDSGAPSTTGPPAVHGSPSSGFVNIGVSGTLTLAKPSATSPGDVLIAFTVTERAFLPTPAGWTDIPNTAVQADNACMQAFSRVAGASEPGSYSFTQIAGNAYEMAGGILAISGADASNPIHASGGLAASTATTACTAPSLSTTIPNTLLLYGCGTELHSSTTSAPITAPNGTSALWDVTSQADYHLEDEVASRTFAATGPTGELVGTIASAHLNAGLAIAVAPIPGARD